MIDWGLLAIQSIGVFVLTFVFCRGSYKRGHRAGRAEGFQTGYAIGKMDERLGISLVRSAHE